MAQPPSPAAGNGAAAMPPDPGTGADADSAGGGEVVVTICSNGDGTYTVYPGDEPEEGGEDQGNADMSEDDDDAMGAAGAAPAGGNGGAGLASTAPAAPQGQPADSIGAALKLALDIMQSEASSQGAPGSADDQMNAGFSASQSPTPATRMAQKY